MQATIVPFVFSSSCLTNSCPIPAEAPVTTKTASSSPFLSACGAWSSFGGEVDATAVSGSSALSEGAELGSIFRVGRTGSVGIGTPSSGGGSFGATGDGSGGSSSFSSGGVDSASLGVAGAPDSLFSSGNSCSSSGIGGDAGTEGSCSSASLGSVGAPTAAASSSFGSSGLSIELFSCGTGGDSGVIASSSTWGGDKSSTLSGGDDGFSSVGALSMGNGESISSGDEESAMSSLTSTVGSSLSLFGTTTAGTGDGGLPLFSTSVMVLSESDELLELSEVLLSSSS
mmetsp:Transcript_19614/g.40681  ORF Transcript_19614/g.40681 Transcript_19614/m.40681 type:complete len:285 (+) Transcript_19614:1824-2678(+)